MKSFTVQEAQTQLGQLIIEAHRGDVIVLTDGDKEVVLNPRAAIDPQVNSPELEAELLKAVRGAHGPFAESELRELADRAVGEHRARRKS